MSTDHVEDFSRCCSFAAGSYVDDSNPLTCHNCPGEVTVLIPFLKVKIILPIQHELATVIYYVQPN